jgi:uncharacterized secreted protein with C-terminal beta-propeller domain
MRVLPPKRIIVLSLLTVVWVGGVILASSLIRTKREGTSEPPPTHFLPTFASCSALRDALSQNEAKFRELEAKGFALSGREGVVPLAPEPQAPAEAGRGGEGFANDYSRTNVQVEGVDEPDIVKTDGTYVYALTRNRIAIAKAYPPNEAKLVGVIRFDERSSPAEFFVDRETLVVFGDRSSPLPKEPVPLRGGSPGSPEAPTGIALPPYWYEQTTFIEIYNLTDRANPKLVRTIELKGSYLASRLTNGMVYFVLQSTPVIPVLGETVAPGEAGGEGESGSPEATVTEDEAFVPQYREAKGPLAISQPYAPIVSCDRIAHPDPIVANEYLTVVGFPLEDPTADLTKEVVLGAGSIVYASATNLYVGGVNYSFGPVPLSRDVIPEIFPPISPEEETIIHAFALSRKGISYRGAARAPGHLLNQFAMDEYGENFRIATTVNESWGGGIGIERPLREDEDDEDVEPKPSTNNVFVFDRELKRIGAIENIAPGETIFAVRFLGNRAYLVTFKKVDPFFVIDLADPRNPKLLGKLKIPGFSDYLHPYDATHLIGVGKNAEDAPEEEFAWYEGMKLALFDVSDPEHPIELHKVDIGDRGTDSPALFDHRAFFFDPKRHLLVLPILLVEIPPERKTPEVEDGGIFLDYGEYVFQGSYVYEVTPEKGFVLKGRVTHLDDPVAYFRKNPYGDEGNLFIDRNLRINDVLYSISGSKMQAHALSDLSKLADVPF